MDDKTALQVLNEQQREEALRQRLRSLDETIAKANAAADKLVRCAESISNPIYSVSMEGHQGQLQVQAVRHFQGQICLTVANPFEVVPGRKPKSLYGSRTEMIEDAEIIEQPKIEHHGV